MGSGAPWVSDADSKDPLWQDVGSAEELRAAPLHQLSVGRLRLAISYREGVFGAVHGACSHAGGPLGDGTLDGDYVVCPWHHWKYHRLTGLGEPGYEEDAVPRYPIRVKDGRVLVDVANDTRRTRIPHAPHPLARKVERTPGPPRVLGISTTNMELGHPRYSTSDALLEHALAFAGTTLGVQQQLIRLRDLSFRACEGFYSKSARACTWPCSITQMDPSDQLDQVYEAVVHWADVVLVATPIRWGNASALAAARPSGRGNAPVARRSKGAPHDPEPRTGRGRAGLTRPQRAPVGSEGPIAGRERLTEGPRDSYGRVAVGLMCPGDGPKKGQMAVLETRTGRHARPRHAMACIRRTGRREEPFSVSRKIRLRAGRSGDGSRQPAHARLPRPTRVAQPPGHQGSRHPMHGGSAKRGSRMRSSEAPAGDGVG